MSKTAILIKAIVDAMEVQGFSQKTLAQVAGMSQSMLSRALRGEYNLKAEKWEALCEALALDYSAITADTPREEVLHMTSDAAVEMTTADEKGRVVAEYLARKLREDVSRGTDMPLEDLLTLLQYASREARCG